jgi:hypothetical protein
MPGPPGGGRRAERSEVSVLPPSLGDANRCWAPRDLIDARVGKGSGTGRRPCRRVVGPKREYPLRPPYRPALLTAVYAMLKTGQAYHDLGPHHLSDID